MDETSAGATRNNAGIVMFAAVRWCSHSPLGKWQDGRLRLTVDKQVPAAFEALSHYRLLHLLTPTTVFPLRTWFPGPVLESLCRCELVSFM